MNALLIAGSDKGVGKTVLTIALAAYWKTYCGARPLGVMKPIETGVKDCGDDERSFSQGEDCDRYTQILNLGQSPKEMNPLRFEAPLVPPLAAAQAGQKVKLEALWRSFESLCQSQDFVLVEGLHGLGTPITAETTMADLAWDWRIPIVLVVPVQPGAIAQAATHVALAHCAKAYLKGIVLNCVQPCTEEQVMDWASPRLIQSLTQKPVLGCLPHIADITDLSKLAQLASHLEIERLLPLGVVNN